MKFLHVFFLNYPKTQTVLSYIVKFSQSLPNLTFCFSDVDRNKICPKNMKDTSIKSKNNDLTWLPFFREFMIRFKISNRF
ncbi:hypothetical protein LEP1GSC161_1849 [Leptospira santarosai str. CBC1416]|uniref:Uncharacterized protein n=1 Tax=Leptospira santarosai str. CBC1416 TaxID=1193059 RepID=M6WCJ2_9LEPT|nr:hypothetical protein LEP1GSC161_1849 [Leptospira santarosai str. CBC1416]